MEEATKLRAALTRIQELATDTPFCVGEAGDTLNEIVRECETVLSGEVEAV